MDSETLKRANEIHDNISDIHRICIDVFTNGTIKLYTKDPMGIYLNKQVSEDVKNAIYSIREKYKKELESL